MNVSKIINRVRWCIDEAKDYSDFEDTYMDDIIKSHLSDALRWCCMYGDGSFLGQSSGSDTTSVIKDYVIKIDDGDEGAFEEATLNGVALDKEALAALELKYATNYGKNSKFVMDYDFLKVARVRCSGWHQAIMEPIGEDSEEYLMLYDPTSKASLERPQVAIIESNPQRIEIYPQPSAGDTIELTVIVNPAVYDAEGTTTTTYDVPDKVSTAFVYYLAFLVLSAYNDITKANQMLAIAKMHLGQATTTDNE